MMRSDRVLFGTTVLTSLLLAAAFSTGPAVAADKPASPAAQIKRLLTQLPQKDAICSARIVDLQTGAVIAEVNADQKVIPASNQKLWVLAAAAVELGPKFQFRTVLGLQDGRVWVVGDGDPGFGDPPLCARRGESVTAELERWAGMLAQRGFKNLEGKLCFDDTIFGPGLTHASWSASDQRKWYGAPVSGLNINDNCVDITVWPAKEAGAPVLWSLSPANDIVQVVNRCVSGGKGEPILDRPGADMRYVISGRCGKRWEFPSVAATDPTALFAATFQRALADKNIAAGGPVQVRRARLANGELAGGFEVLAEHRTPIADVMGRVGKNSQNLFAEALLKRLGYEWARRQGHSPAMGSWETGRSAILAFAGRADISIAPEDIADGSGLSRENRLSAGQAVDLLTHLYRHPARDLFVDSLAVGGEDGSLEKRMRGLPGSVHAKTGYLSGVRTLSGYVKTPGGRWFAFSILFNKIKGGTAPFNKIHDEVCRLLATWPAAETP